MAHINNHTLVINIPADGLFLAIQNKAAGDLSEKNVTRIIVEYIDKYLEAKPDVICVNVCYRRCLTPSEVFDSYLYDVETDENGFAVRDENGKTCKTISPTTDGGSYYFQSFFACARVLLQNNIDIYQVVIRHIRAAGCKVYLSIRTNDQHYTKNTAINSYFAVKNNGIHTIDRDGELLDYSQKAVQNHYLEYIRELLDTYAFDGLELDLLRKNKMLPPHLRADYSILNGFVQRIRNLLDDYGNNLNFAVRLLPYEQDNLDNGIDACQWVANGWVNMLTIENFYIPANFELPFAQWRASIDKKNTAKNPYLLLGGSDWGVSCVRRYNIAMTPPLVRGFATECLFNGADGIYLFNMFEEDASSSFELVVPSDGAPYLKTCFSERLKAGRNIDVLPRRYVHVPTALERYPILLDPQGCYAFEYQVKRPFNSCRITVGLDEDVPFSVLVSGKEIPLRQDPVLPGFEYIPEEEIRKKADFFIHAVSQLAPYMYSAAMPISPEGNETVEITLQNNSTHSTNILWLDLLFE